MKRFLLPLFLSVAVLAFAATLDDSYDTGRDNYIKLYDAGYIRAGQSFTSGGGTLDSCKFRLEKGGSPPGNMYAELYAHSGTYGSTSVPTGSALGTSDAVAASTAYNYDWVTFSFTGGDRYSMGAGYYVIALYYEDGDSGNYILVGTDATSPTHDGNAAREWEGSGWTALGTGTDCLFEVYVADEEGGARIIGGGIIG